jgi:hypothetical protein
VETRGVMDQLISFLKEFNIQTILSMGLIMWYFTSDVKKSLEIKIDKLDNDVREMNSRICRIEGTVYGKDVYKHIDEKKV